MIHATPIRRDAQGRYCLNDLHRAAGGENRHVTAQFIRLSSTKELAAAISNHGDSHISPIDLSRGRYGGTYVHEDLAIDYAAWIIPVFKLEPLRGLTTNIEGRPHEQARPLVRGVKTAT
jgi:hypothetical protein